MRPMALIENSGNMVDFADGFFPPDFLMWKTYVSEMWITIQIAIWGTALAIVCSIPFGILCSENIVPFWVYQPVRRLMDSFRAINEMVFAMPAGLVWFFGNISGRFITPKPQLL